MLVVEKLKRGLAILILICLFLPLRQCASSPGVIEVLIPADATTHSNFYSSIYRDHVKEGVATPAKVVSSSAGDLFDISIFTSIFFWPIFFQTIATKTHTRRTYILLNLTETLLCIGSVFFLLGTLGVGIRYEGILALSSYALYFLLSAGLTISYFRSSKSLIQQSIGTTKRFATFFFAIALAAILGYVYNLGCSFILGCAPTTGEYTGEDCDDTVITSKVKSAILGDPSLKSAEIYVETFKGVVQLSGFVSSAAVEDKAVEVARSVKCIKLVKNDMRLK